MYYIQGPFAHVPLVRERLTMLFAEMAGFACTCHFLFGKGEEFDDDSFSLHPFGLWEIDVADSFVPHLYVGVGFMAFGIHGCFHLMRVEN